MSGVSDSKPCPVCGCDMNVYIDWKPFDTVNMECVSCGFNGYVKIGMECDEDRLESWKAEGLDAADFEPLSKTDRKRYLDVFKSLCGPGELSAREEAEYLEGRSCGNSRRDEVKDIIAELLVESGVSEAMAFEKAAECADRIFDVMGMPEREQDEAVER